MNKISWADNEKYRLEDLRGCIKTLHNNVEDIEKNLFFYQLEERIRVQDKETREWMRDWINREIYHLNCEVCKFVDQLAVCVEHMNEIVEKKKSKFNIYE